MSTLWSKGYFMRGNCISESCSCPSPGIPYQSGFLSVSSNHLVLWEISAVHQNESSISKGSIITRDCLMWNNELKMDEFTCWKSSVIRRVWLSTFLVFITLTMAASICNQPCKNVTVNLFPHGQSRYTRNLPSWRVITYSPLFLI